MSGSKYVILCRNPGFHGWEYSNTPYYDTREEAEEAMDDLISSSRDAAAKGCMDEAYDPEHWKVVKDHD